MTNSITRQALPSKNYLELLGTAICVFNSNNAFIIENILRIDSFNYDWNSLIDETSGRLKPPLKKTISKNSGNKIAVMFDKLVEKRNRIIHSFQVTADNDEQMLRTNVKNGHQFNITREYLIEFIHDNEMMSTALDHLRSQ